jgi:class 3 adenylate cyclase
MMDLPRGTVTFLFTDIAGSTALWRRAARRETRSRARK